MNLFVPQDDEFLGTLKGHRARRVQRGTGNRLTLASHLRAHQRDQRAVMSRDPIPRVKLLHSRDHLPPHLHHVGRPGIRATDASTSVARGLEVSLRYILENLPLQRQLRHQTLEFRVLLLQLFQSFGLIKL